MYLFYRNIVLGFVAIAIGLSGIRYCIGWPKYGAEKEEKRIERVKKYGVFLLICSIGAIAGGASLLTLAVGVY
jgi:hypothetical protein